MQLRCLSRHRSARRRACRPEDGSSDASLGLVGSPSGRNSQGGPATAWRSSGGRFGGLARELSNVSGGRGGSPEFRSPRARARKKIGAVGRLGHFKMSPSFVQIPSLERPFRSQFPDDLAPDFGMPTLCGRTRPLVLEAWMPFFLHPQLTTPSWRTLHGRFCAASRSGPLDS